MATFTLTINTGNAEMLTGTDVSRALEEVAESISFTIDVSSLEEFGERSAAIRDDNGQKVGSWAILPSEEAPEEPMTIREALTLAVAKSEVQPEKVIETLRSITAAAEKSTGLYGIDLQIEAREANAIAEDFLFTHLR